MARQHKGLPPDPVVDAMTDREHEVVSHCSCGWQSPNCFEGWWCFEHGSYGDDQGCWSLGLKRSGEFCDMRRVMVVPVGGEG